MFFFLLLLLNFLFGVVFGFWYGDIIGEDVKEFLVFCLIDFWMLCVYVKVCMVCEDYLYGEEGFFFLFLRKGGIDLFFFCIGFCGRVFL